MTNQKIILRGLSKHGKNIINQHGNEWLCIGEKSHLNVAWHRPSDSGFMLLANSTDMRWIDRKDDIDFEVLSAHDK
tara:strand:- start:75 stop:302 length:228 start_codon:yes stop_codon:yes gene_type:complete